MSDGKDFDIDSLLQVEPPKKADSDILELVEDTNKQESVSVDTSTDEKKKVESTKKSLFSFGKKEEKSAPAKNNKVQSQQQGKKKIMLLVFVAVSVAMGGAMVMQQMKSKNVANSPFPTMPSVAQPQQPANVVTPQNNAINPALPAGLAKAPEIATQPPVPATTPETTGNVNPPTPVSTEGVSATTENKSASATPELPKLNTETIAKKEDVSDKVVAEQKEALNKILAATEANMKPKETVPTKEEINPKHEVKVVDAVDSGKNAREKVDTSNHYMERQPQITNSGSIKQLEIIELSAKYVKVATLSGKVITYEVGDLLPGNAKITKIDVHKEKIYTNKGNIVIQ